MNAAPHAFLSHASEDGVLAVRLAKDLLASGIDAFLDVWDITAGDSLRQRIDAGLGTCTHFLVLLTPTSISKPWRSAEIDAAFVQKVLGRCKFVPVRSNLSASDLPPLLGALYSPSLDDYEVAVQSLIADLYGVSRKPPIGMPPAFMKPALPAETGLAPAARSIVICLIQGSQHGLEDDPLLSIHELQQETGLPEESLVDAAFELEERGLVRLRRDLNVGPAGFDLVRPTASLFVAFDPFAMTWSPEVDALQIAVRLVSSGEGALVQTLAIVSHGDKRGFFLPGADGRTPKPEELGAEFKRVKNVGIRAVFLSSCKSARGRRMATAITQNGGIPYVVGYMNNAYDSRCCLADQLFYYQVLFARPGAPIETAVRRVNDALFLVGEKPERMLGCWHVDGEKVLGPSPWWAEEWAHSTSPEETVLPGDGS